jgi:hypothetical protein
MLVAEPLTKMTIHARIRGRESSHDIYEGEATMSQQQQDQYKDLIGDGLAKVTVGRDLGEKDFGSGGGVIVNVTLTCDQSAAKIGAAIALAHQVADGSAWHYQQQLKQQLLQTGILKP